MELTIDQLAVAAEVPARTIREYQRLGLLNPPRRDGRVGMYDVDHRARLAIIGRLQERGYSLAAIGDLIESWEAGNGLGSVLGVDANPAVLDETPTVLTIDLLHEVVPALADPKLLDEATLAGLIHDLDGQLAVRSLAALDLVALSTDAGIPIGEAIEIVAAIQVGAANIAHTAVGTFVEHLWPAPDDIDLASTLARARLLLAQAAASLVVNELGVALYRLASDEPDDAQFAELIAQLSIGSTRNLTTANIEGQLP